MPNKKFWLNYALCWLALAGFWWWLQVGYFYVQHERLKVKPLEVICLAFFAILISMVSDSEFDAVKINPGIKLFVFKILGPVLRSRFGFLLPLFLLGFTGFLFFQSRQVHLAWKKIPLSAHVLVVTPDGEREITGEMRGADRYVLPLDRGLLRDGTLEVRDDYGMLRQGKALSRVFGWWRYLSAGKFDLGDHFSQDEFGKPVKVAIHFLSAENQYETDEGSLNPTSACWKKFSPEGGIPAFFASVADAYSRQKKPFAVGAYVPAVHENVNYMCRFTSRQRLEIVDERVELTAAVLAELTGMARRIVDNDSQNDYSDFHNWFRSFSPKSKNRIVARVVGELAVAPGWRRELNRNNIMGMGNLLDLFTQCTSELNDENIRLLFTSAFPLFDEYLGESRIILPMVALLRLSASICGQNAKTETNESYQNKLLARLEAFFKASSYNVIKWRFLRCARGHVNDLPTKNSLPGYVSCLRAVLDGGANYVRSAAADLVGALRGKWGGQAEFDGLYRDFLADKSRWPFTRQEVELQIESQVEIAPREAAIRIPD